MTKYGFSQENWEAVEYKMLNSDDRHFFNVCVYNDNKASRYFYKLHIDPSAPAVSAPQKEWEKFLNKKYAYIVEENRKQWEEKRAKEAQEKQAHKDALIKKFKETKTLRGEEVYEAMQMVDGWKDLHIRTKGLFKYMTFFEVCKGELKSYNYRMEKKKKVSDAMAEFIFENVFKFVGE